MALKGHNRNVKDVTNRLEDARKRYAADPNRTNARVLSALLKGQAEVLRHIAESIDSDLETAETMIAKMNQQRAEMTYDRGQGES